MHVLGRRTLSLPGPENHIYILVHLSASAQRFHPATLTAQPSTLESWASVSLEIGYLFSIKIHHKIQ